MSEFYRRRSLGFRTAFFFSAIALAGAFSGLLAAAIINLNGKGGKEGWVSAMAGAHFFRSTKTLRLCLFQHFSAGFSTCAYLYRLWRDSDRGSLS